MIDRITWNNVAEDLYTRTVVDETFVYSFVDADNDDIPDMVDSCLDSNQGDRDKKGCGYG